jgi:hypothetical protein
MRMRSAAVLQEVRPIMSSKNGKVDFIGSANR